MSKANLRNALSILTSKEFKEKGEFNLKDKDTITRIFAGTEKDKYTEEYLMGVINQHVKGLRHYKKFDYLKEMEDKFNVDLKELVPE